MVVLLHEQLDLYEWDFSVTRRNPVYEALYQSNSWLLGTFDIQLPGFVWFLAVPMFRTTNQLYLVIFTFPPFSCFRFSWPLRTDSPCRSRFVHPQLLPMALPRAWQSQLVMIQGVSFDDNFRFRVTNWCIHGVNITSFYMVGYSY